MSHSPDLTLARRFVDRHRPPGRVLLCGITGSHQYGFASADSDMDLKGIHVAPARRVLGLTPPLEAFDRLQVFESVECDLTTNEIGQALRLLLSGNGNMLERILSPFQLYDSTEARELRQLALGAVSRSFHRHYAGFFRAMCIQHQRSGTPRAKTLLYAYRVALTGSHLLRSGELVADLAQLAPAYGFDAALELLEQKRAGSEHETIAERQEAAHRADWPKLEAALAGAIEESRLPETAPNREECEDWLVELRATDLCRKDAEQRSSESS